VLDVAGVVEDAAALTSSVPIATSGSSRSVPLPALPGQGTGTSLEEADAPGGLAGVDTTVKTHITHIPQKLNLRDRVQAVVLAYETGLFDSGGRTEGDRDELTAR
jgi:hypothetical protein